MYKYVTMRGCVCANLFSDPEVTDFELPRGGEHEIARLDVPMYNTFAMQVI